MNDLRTAAKMALEAMEEAHNLLPGMYDKHIVGIKQRHFNAITALRTALAQQEQEPVAWGGVTWGVDWGRDGENLFTHPPRREWRSLSDEEINALWASHDKTGEQITRAVEQALKEKNQ